MSLGVPLALVTLARNNVIAEDSIEIQGRPVAHSHAEALTHVVQMNWKHGSVKSLSELRDMKALRIYFDGPLQQQSDRSSRCTGINEYTFVVEAVNRRQEQHRVTYLEPPHLEDGYVAVFDINPHDPALPRSMEYEYLKNCVVYVTLKCDFVMDSHGKPVDGDHLGGVLPSGNGIQGGTFESWFAVRDEEYSQRARD